MSTFSSYNYLFNSSSKKRTSGATYPGVPHLLYTILSKGVFSLVESPKSYFYYY